MIREAPLRHTITFRIEADNYEALKAAVEYVMAFVADSTTGYVCGSHLCICKPKAEWDGNSQLIVKSCVKRAAYAVAKLLAKMYSQHGGRMIRIVKCEEYRI
jgi:hypothetical protein